MANEWDGQTVCIIASGPSLTRADADYARLAARRVIVVNNAWKLCPKADTLYAADAQWWFRRAPSADEFKGERLASARNTQWVHTPPPPGVSLLATKQGAAIANSYPIYEGANSSFQALGIAMLRGVRKVTFLGLDLKPSDAGASHFDGDHPPPMSNPSPQAFAVWREAFERVAPALAARGVEVINASRRTALTCFPRKVITDALP